MVPRTSTTLVSGGTDEIFVGALIELTFVPLVEVFWALATCVEDPFFPSNIAVRIPARARSPSNSSSQGLQQDFSYLGRGAGGEIDVREAPAYWDCHPPCTVSTRGSWDTLTTLVLTFAGDY